MRSSRRWRVALEPDFPAVAATSATHAEWTHATKLLGTFGESLAQWLDDDGRLRGQLKVGGTVTLRHSASQPNVQQMPSARPSSGRCSRRRPGASWSSATISQIELRLAAIIAPDEALLEVYREGRDVHAEVAEAIGLPRGAQSEGRLLRHDLRRRRRRRGRGERPVARARGRGGRALPRRLSAASRAYRERAPREAEALGYIPIRPGRRVLYDPVLSKGTQAINYAVQGGAASVQMRALRRVYDALAAPALARHAAGRRDP